MEKEFDILYKSGKNKYEIKQVKIQCKSNPENKVYIHILYIDNTHTQIVITDPTIIEKLMTLESKKNAASSFTTIIKPFIESDQNYSLMPLINVKKSNIYKNTFKLDSNDIIEIINTLIDMDINDRINVKHMTRKVKITLPFDFKTYIWQIEDKLLLERRKKTDFTNEVYSLVSNIDYNKKQLFITVQCEKDVEFDNVLLDLLENLER